MPREYPMTPLEVDAQRQAIYGEQLRNKLSNPPPPPKRRAKRRMGDMVVDETEAMGGLATVAGTKVHRQGDEVIVQQGPSKPFRQGDEIPAPEDPAEPNQERFDITKPHDSITGSRDADQQFVEGTKVDDLAPIPADYADLPWNDLRTLAGSFDSNSKVTNKAGALEAIKHEIARRQELNKKSTA